VNQYVDRRWQLGLHQLLHQLRHQQQEERLGRNAVDKQQEEHRQQVVEHLDMELVHPVLQEVEKWFEEQVDREQEFRQ
jgi:hypothetical protein